MSKLYTEEQMKLFYELGKFDGIIGKEYNIDEEIKKLTPIELPTDEEIEEVAKDKINLSADCFGQYDFTSGKQDGFIDGAIWMRDKIKGGNK